MAKFFHLIALLATITTALAIKCYECDSSKNAACNIGFLSFTQSVVDCDEKASSGGGFSGWVGSVLPKNCIKITAKDVNDNEFVARSCGINTGINLCDTVAKTIGFMSSQDGVRDMRCHVCDTDKCNSGNVMGATVILSVLSACFLFLF